MRSRHELEVIKNFVDSTYSNFGNKLIVDVDKKFDPKSRTELGFCFKHIDPTTGGVTYKIDCSKIGIERTDFRIMMHEYAHIYLGHLDGIHEELDTQICNAFRDHRAEIIESIMNKCGIDYKTADRLIERIIDDPMLNHQIHNIAMDMECNSSVLSEEDVNEMELDITSVLPKYEEEILKKAIENANAEDYKKALNDHLREIETEAKIKLIVPGRYNMGVDENGNPIPFPDNLTYADYIVLIVTNIDQFVKMCVSIQMGGNGDTQDITKEDVMNALSGMLQKMNQRTSQNQSEAYRQGYQQALRDARAGRVDPQSAVKDMNQQLDGQSQEFKDGFQQGFKDEMEKTLGSEDFKQGYKDGYNDEVQKQQNQSGQQGNQQQGQQGQQQSDSQGSDQQPGQQRQGQQQGQGSSEDYNRGYEAGQRDAQMNGQEGGEGSDQQGQDQSSGEGQQDYRQGYQQGQQMADNAMNQGPGQQGNSGGQGQGQSGDGQGEGSGQSQEMQDYNEGYQQALQDMANSQGQGQGQGLSDLLQSMGISSGGGMSGNPGSGGSDGGTQPHNKQDPGQKKGEGREQKDSLNPFEGAGKRDQDHMTDSRREADSKRELGQIQAGGGVGMGRGNGPDVTREVDKFADDVDIALGEVLNDVRSRVVKSEVQRDTMKLYNRGIIRSVIAPSLSRKVTISTKPKLVFLIDVSSSMNTRLIDRILKSISKSLKKLNRDLRYDIITWSDYLGEHIKNIDPRKSIPRISSGGGTEMARGMEYFKEHYGPEAILVLISDFCDSLDEWHKVELTMPRYSMWGFNYGSNRYSYRRGDWEWKYFKQRNFSDYGYDD
jgi:hypothetical protein